MLLPSVLLVLAGLSQAVYFTFTRNLITGGLSGPGCVLWQCVTGTLVYAWLCIRQDKFPKFSGQHWFFHISLALIYIVIPSILVFILSNQVAIGVISIVGCLSPICTYLIVLLLGIERLDFRRAAGLVLGLCGAVLLIAPAADFGVSAHWGWTLLALVLPVCFALSNIMRQRYWPEGETPTSLIFGVMLMGSVVLLPYCLLSGTFFWPFEVPTSLTFIFIGYLALTISFIYLAFLIVRLAGAVFVSQIGYVVAMGGMLLGYFMYGEQPNYLAILAALLIIGGLSLVIRRQA